MSSARLSLVAIFASIAIGCVLLQAHYRHDRFRVGIWWAEGTTDADRERLEATLGLIDPEPKRDRWMYRLKDYSTTSVAAIVEHPSVRLTQNIDRQARLVFIDAPALPAFLKRILTSNLGLGMSAASGAIGLVLFVLWRRDWQAVLRSGPAGTIAPVTIVLLLAIYAVEVARTAWIGDDAAITLRTVLNFINGYGPRFNLDERVQAYTHPLWFLLVSAISFISNNVFASVLWLSVACSLATLLVLLRSRASLANAVIVAGALLLSKAYVDFSASGLENPLSHLIALATSLAALRYLSDPRERWLLLSCLGMAAAYLTRPDLILIVFPLVAFAVVRHRPSPAVLMRSVVFGALPAVAWTALAVYYYGSPFPNPAYAKLGAGVPIAERVAHGFRYFVHSMPRDPLTLVLIVMGVVIGLVEWGAGAAIAAGVVVYLAYVVAIGGDFMEGRFMTCALLLSGLVLIRARHSKARLTAIAICVAAFGAFGLDNTLLSGASYKDEEIPPDGISDERGYYFQDYGWLNAGDEVFDELEWKIETGERHPAYLKCGGLGFASILDGPTVHYIDRCGLSDPLLARLPASGSSDGRVGHFERAIPAGYEESVRTETNRLADPALHAFYDSIRLVTRGDLNDPGRLLEVVRLNAGLVRAPR